MKVAQINVTYGDADSTGRNVKEFHHFLKNNGIESVVFTSSINDGSSEDGEIHKFSSGLDRRIHATLSRLTGKQGYFSKRSTQKLISCLSGEHPDVVILHVLHGNCINFPLLCKFLSASGIPVMIVLHDCWYYTGHCCHYTEADCYRWKLSCGDCPQVHKWNKSWFFDRSKQCLADKKMWFNSLSKLAVVGVSNWGTNEARQSILRDALIIKKIYNWVDLNIFQPRNAVDLREKLGISPNQKVLLGVSSQWNNQKGLQEILLVAKELSSCKIVLVGDIPQNLERAENIICVGLIRDPVLLAQYYSVADVFLNPSVQETFGKTTAEALSCGTPCVVYNTTACAELIGEGCGKVVPAFNRSLYVQYVSQQINQNDAQTAHRCRMFAQMNFSGTACMQKYLDTLTELVNTDVEDEEK